MLGTGMAAETELFDPHAKNMVWYRRWKKAETVIRNLRGGEVGSNVAGYHQAAERTPLLASSPTRERGGGARTTMATTRFVSEGSGAVDEVEEVEEEDDDHYPSPRFPMLGEENLGWNGWNIDTSEASKGAKLGARSRLLILVCACTVLMIVSLFTGGSNAWMMTTTAAATTRKDDAPLAVTKVADTRKNLASEAVGQKLFTKPSTPATTRDKNPIKKKRRMEAASSSSSSSLSSAAASSSSSSSVMSADDAVREKGEEAGEEVVEKTTAARRRGGARLGPNSWLWRRFWCTRLGWGATPPTPRTLRRSTPATPRSARTPRTAGRRRAIKKAGGVSSHHN